MKHLEKAIRFLFNHPLSVLTFLLRLQTIAASAGFQSGVRRGEGDQLSFHSMETFQDDIEFNNHMATALQANTDKIHLSVPFSSKEESDFLEQFYFDYTESEMTDEQLEEYFYKALQKNYFAAIEYFIELNVVNINVKFNNGQTLLHYSILNSETIFSKYLIKNNIDLNTIDENYNTPLFLAIQKKQDTIAKNIILNKNWEPNYVLLTLYTRSQIRNAKIEEVLPVLKKGVRIFPKDDVLASEYIMTFFLGNEEKKAIRFASNFLKKNSKSKEIISTLLQGFVSRKMTQEVHQLLKMMVSINIDDTLYISEIKQLYATHHKRLTEQSQVYYYITHTINSIQNIYLKDSRDILYKRYNAKITEYDLFPTKFDKGVLFSKDIIFYNVLDHYFHIQEINQLYEEYFNLNKTQKNYIDEALSIHDKILSKLKKDIPYFNNQFTILYSTIGYLNFLKGDHEKAIKCLNTAFSIQLVEPTAKDYYIYAQSAFKIKENKLAQLALQRALGIEPDNQDMQKFYQQILNRLTILDKKDIQIYEINSYKENNYTYLIMTTLMIIISIFTIYSIKLPNKKKKSQISEDPALEFLNNLTKDIFKQSWKRNADVYSVAIDLIDSFNTNIDELKDEKYTDSIKYVKLNADLTIDLLRKIFKTLFKKDLQVQNQILQISLESFQNVKAFHENKINTFRTSVFKQSYRQSKEYQFEVEKEKLNYELEKFNSSKNMGKNILNWGQYKINLLTTDFEGNNTAISDFKKNIEVNYEKEYKRSRNEFKARIKGITPTNWKEFSDIEKANSEIDKLCISYNRSMSSLKEKAEKKYETYINHLLHSFSLKPKEKTRHECKKKNKKHQPDKECNKKQNSYRFYHENFHDDPKEEEIMEEIIETKVPTIEKKQKEFTYDPNEILELTNEEISKFVINEGAEKENNSNFFFKKKNKKNKKNKTTQDIQFTERENEVVEKILVYIKDSERKEEQVEPFWYHYLIETKLMYITNLLLDEYKYHNSSNIVQTLNKYYNFLSNNLNIIRNNCFSHNRYLFTKDEINELYSKIVTIVGKLRKSNNELSYPKKITSLLPIAFSTNKDPSYYQEKYNLLLDSLSAFIDFLEKPLLSNVYKLSDIQMLIQNYFIKLHELSSKIDGAKESLNKITENIPQLQIIIEKSKYKYMVDKNKIYGETKIDSKKPFKGVKNFTDLVHRVRNFSAHNEDEQFDDIISFHASTISSEMYEDIIELLKVIKDQFKNLKIDIKDHKKTFTIN